MSKTYSYDCGNRNLTALMEMLADLNHWGVVSDAWFNAAGDHIGSVAGEIKRPESRLDYAAPPETNPEYANVLRWSVNFECRCGTRHYVQDSPSRYVRLTCPDCGTAWEVAPSLTDATPHVIGKTEDPRARS